MKDLKAWLLYGGATLAVLAPLLLPGFILTLDMVFVPDMPLPHDVTSSYLFYAALHVLHLVLPSDVLQKIILLSILLLSCFGMHRLVRSVALKQPVGWGVYVASMFYAINPFTYSRFMAGQFAVLLGYALLPWVARLMILFAQRPNFKNSLKIGLLVTLVGIVSIHSLVAVTILGLVGLAISWRTSYLKYAALVVGIVVALSGYWLVPLALGQGKTASTISSFTAADSAAFASVGDNALAKAFHVVRLQGFWAEAKNLYLLPQDQIIGWGLMLFVLIGIAIFGAVTLWPARKKLVLWLGGSALIGLLLAIGIGSRFIPGLREPHKMVMLVALFYSLFLAFGINELLARWQKKNETLYSAGVVLAFAIPTISMLVMWWGFSGQLQPRNYPDDWRAAKTQLSQDNGQGKIVFLPWHQYMTFRFAGRVIANPAPAYFGGRVVVSQNPELDGATNGSTSAEQQVLSELMQNPAQQDVGQQLARHDIRYVLLTKELDYEKYGFLTEQPVFKLVQDYPTLTLYENTAWRQL